MTIEEFGEEAFKKLPWSGEYGGKMWELICKDVERLTSATDPDQLSIIIDHIHDLHHNTGTVFDKTLDRETVAKFNKLLDLKRNVAVPTELLNFSSVSPDAYYRALRAIMKQ
jgi:hypothetical protein